MSDEPKLLPGLFRLKRLLKLAGGIPKHAKRCPQCGGRAVLEDDGMRARPMCTKTARYSIACRDGLCVVVIGPSVRWVVKQWVVECAAKKEAA